MVERLEAYTVVINMQGMSFKRVYLRCGPCHDRYPNGRPVLVGEAFRDQGFWWSYRTLRVGKNASPDGARMVEENDHPGGPEVRFLWSEDGEPLGWRPVAGRLATDYECGQKKHRVGLDEETLRWALDKAVERGEPALYLPVLSDRGSHSENRPGETVAGSIPRT